MAIFCLLLLVGFSHSIRPADEFKALMAESKGGSLDGIPKTDSNRGNFTNSKAEFENLRRFVEILAEGLRKQGVPEDKIADVLRIGQLNETELAKTMPKKRRIQKRSLSSNGFDRRKSFKTHPDSENLLRFAAEFAENLRRRGVSERRIAEIFGIGHLTELETDTTPRNYDEDEEPQFPRGTPSPRPYSENLFQFVSILADGLRKQGVPEDKIAEVEKFGFYNETELSRNLPPKGRIETKSSEDKLSDDVKERMDKRFNDLSNWSCGSYHLDSIARALLQMSCNRCVVGFVNMNCYLHDNCYECRNGKAFCDKNFDRDMHRLYGHCEDESRPCWGMLQAAMTSVEYGGGPTYVYGIVRSWFGKSDCDGDLPASIEDRFSIWPPDEEKTLM
ncbi:unnamed protein product [Caenorhabditis auriculariae]|uniref:Uncharacterized protein n=1 Tax=Caenorhabditis auriculariae TaxID=2777116 RepID=A0A8S1H336_9PELO|nr:unnamed protein product [Caenorhabditis auriculariae]